MSANSIIEIAGTKIYPGERKTIELPTADLYTHTAIRMPVHVIHGQLSGPRLFVMGTLHGDELNGVEIIRHLLTYKRLKNIRGTLITVPIANIYGFINLSRYLPDRRDLNRTFPGSKTGSLASRLANMLVEQIVMKCTHGIDLHTGSGHRVNLPQIRVNCENKKTLALAKAFAAPLIVNAAIRPGSLRSACEELNIPLLLFETGEALRLDEHGIKVGIKGILNVMRKLRMLKSLPKTQKTASLVSKSTHWLRAPQSGLLHSKVKLGSKIKKGESLGLVTDPFGEQEAAILASRSGVIIGMTNLPVVNEGDAIFHVAVFGKSTGKSVAESADIFEILEYQSSQDE
jgi:predicted deacylase